MKRRRIGEFSVAPIGLGCMSLSYAYGTPPDPEAAQALLGRALDLGVDHFDTAALYGYGANEELLAPVIKPHRKKIVLASKCGIFRNADGVREINGRPAVLKKTCEDSLRRLGTEVIDLYYLHRWDKQVPIEESVGALADLLKQGKIRSIGLSEVSADTLRKAYAEHPIAAVQSEYSLWTRNPEIRVLAECRKLGVAFVAFSPLARGFLTGKLRDVTTLAAKDIRRQMPRFEPDNYAANLALLDEFSEIAATAGCSMAQLALAWLLTRGDHVLPLIGTTRMDHLEENLGTAQVALSTQTLSRLDALINQRTVHGARYVASTQAEVDTETFEEVRT
ncbi:MAG: aldo/keto reductase [Proteobacteria bacterium]|nr:aldo/keto reductase [Pseudomonadota bacterium]